MPAELIPWSALVLAALLLVGLLWLSPPRVINWLIFGAGLSLLPLVTVAFINWDPSANTFFKTLTNEELLAVAFALSGAAGVDALTSSGPLVRTQRAIGGITLLIAFALAAFYIIIRTGSHHLTPAFIGDMELILYGLAVILSFFSEIVAG